MSTIIDGNLVESDMTRNARGGTEAMRDRLLKYVDPDLLKGKAIHFSRVTDFQDKFKHILYCHDLAEDTANDHLFNDGWKKFDAFVFVSAWQRDFFIQRFGIPYERSFVIPNAVEVEYDVIEKPTEVVNFIYHTTPHRGLQLLYPIFDTLSKHFDNIHLDVFSSFSIYGWEQRDEPYKELFKAIDKHQKMTYHGAKDNETVLKALKNAHIFLYPCIWKETSCISVIEAIKSGVTVIHPMYGALPETTKGHSIMYDMTENIQDHMQTAANITASVLQNKAIPQTVHVKGVLPENTVPNFKAHWEHVLRKV